MTVASRVGSKNRQSKTSKNGSGELLIIGGREDKEGQMAILSEFVHLAGDQGARIVVMPIATEDGQEIGTQYTKIFEQLGAADVQIVDVVTRNDAYLPDSLELLEKATGVFFTGGSQSRITSLLGGSPVDELLCRRHGEGLVVAGTSAGASIMADTMILRGPAEASPRAGTVVLGSGMGFMSGLLIDQHFSERGRMGRLISAVAQHPRYLGLGIDENTAIVVHECSFRVIGEGAVTVLDGADMSFTNFSTAADRQPLALEQLKLTIVPPGFTYDFQERKLLHPQPDDGRDREIPK